MGNLKLIKTEAEYNSVLKRINELRDAPDGTPEGDELDVLCLIVEKYEEENYPIEDLDPVEYLKIRMEVLGLTQSDLVPYFGDKSSVSKVLSGKRPLSLNNIRALWEGLRLDPQILILPPRLTH